MGSNQSSKRWELPSVVECGAALCEIERHRATLALRLRQTVQQIDAEYQAVDVKLAEPKRPS
jgi:hypothetical protein